MVATVFNSNRTANSRTNIPSWSAGNGRSNSCIFWTSCCWNMGIVGTFL